jgi:hypothetical protein
MWEMQRFINQRWGSTITETVSFHDRQLESWLKRKLAGLVDLFEAQAGAFREQIRRFRDDPAGSGPSVDLGDLESDLRELHAIATAGETVTEQPRAPHAIRG